MLYLQWLRVRNNEFLLWNSQNREYKKYLRNVIVLPEISQ